MKTVNFIIPGNPKGKGRPRVVHRNGFSRAYTPKDTAMYENLVRVEYELQTKRYRFDDDMALEMVIDAYYEIPKSTSKKKKELMLSGYTQIPQMGWLSLLVFIILSTLCVYMCVFFSLASLENSLFQEPNW